MFLRLNIKAALFTSAAFIFFTGFISVAATVFSVNAHAQAPIIDASERAATAGKNYGQSAARPQQPIASQPQDAALQGELFYQLQLLQQEVMQLRGQVEEQAHQLQQLKDQSMERYIDLDRRIGSLSSGTALPTPASGVMIPAAAEGVAKPGEREAYDNAYGLVLNKRFDEALTAFKSFLADYPDGSYAPNAYYWLGELYQVTTPADLEAARQAFSQLLSQYPDHTKVADAMYKLGKVYFLLGNKVASREWLEKVVAQYGVGVHSSAADKARQFLSANF